MATNVFIHGATPWLLALMLSLAGCTLDETVSPAPGRCTAANAWDDDGLWARQLESSTGCAWKCPPNYAYQPALPVAEREVWSGWAAKLESNQNVRVLLLGDGGNLDAVAGVAKAAHAVCAGTCDLGVVVGDNFYSHDVTDLTSQDWASWRAAFEVFCDGTCDAANTFHFWLSLGNHDYFPPSDDGDGNIVQAQIDYTGAAANAGHLWMMPERFYRLPGLPPWLDFWMMDSIAEVETPKWRYEEGEDGVIAQLPVIGEQLAAASPDNWKVVAGHHPALTVGSRINAYQSHDGFRCQSYLEVDTMRQAADQLASAGMHLLASGHEHNQQLHAGDQYLQVLTGSASKFSSDNFNANNTKPVPVSAIAKQEGTYGFAILTFTPEQLTVQLYQLADTSSEASAIDQPKTYSRTDIDDLMQQLGPLLTP